MTPPSAKDSLCAVGGGAERSRGQTVTAVLDSIRRIVAEDEAHSGTTHELYLTRETVRTLPGYGPLRFEPRKGVKCDDMVIPLHVQNVGRDCIATLRGGKIISVTNL